MVRSTPRINYRVLGVFLIVGLPTLVVASMMAMAIGQSRLHASYAVQLAEVAEQTASSVDSFVFRRVVDASILSRVPSIREAAAAATRETPDVALVQKMDAEWQRTHKAPASLAPLFESPASQFLADVARQDPIYREVLLTDLHGRLVAASNLTTDYLQSDEEWWTVARGDGLRGRVAVSDVGWDESARVFALEIALPVSEPGSDRLAGILKVLADIREMGAVIDGVQVGSTGDAALVRPDGSIVLSRRRVDPDARYFATDLLRERYNAVRQGDPQYNVTFSARTADGSNRLVAIAPSQLSVSYPALNWLVAVSQSEDELLGPIRAQIWLQAVAIALVALVVVVLALWFSMRLAAPPITDETNMHLVEHPKPPRLEEPT
jgi:hypothetical protein